MFINFVGLFYYCFIVYFFDDMWLLSSSSNWTRTIYSELLACGISWDFHQVSQSNLRDLLLQCCMDEASDVRQSAFALLGDLGRVSHLDWSLGLFSLCSFMFSRLFKIFNLMNSWALSVCVSIFRWKSNELFFSGGER